MCIQGKRIEQNCDNKGNKTDVFRLVTGGDMARLMMLADQIHSLEAADEMSRIIEFKVGTYEPFKTEDIIDLG